MRAAVKEGQIEVEVVFALVSSQAIRVLRMSEGSTVADAIHASGLLVEFREMAFDVTQLGIFGRLVSAGEILRDGDRVEIYRRLAEDPKDARRRRAAVARGGC